MNRNKKYVLSFLLLALLILSGCILAVPVTEEQLNEVGEKAGVGDALTDIVKSQFTYEMDENGNTVNKDAKGSYSLHIMTSEPKDEVSILTSWNEETIPDGFIYGNNQAGYLRLSNLYQKTESDYSYECKEQDKTITVTIDGFSKDSELSEWVNFIVSGLKEDGYQNISTTLTEQDAAIFLMPDSTVWWNIYLHEENNRIYLTEIVFFSQTVKPEEDTFTGILNNRYYVEDTTEL